MPSSTATAIAPSAISLPALLSASGVSAAAAHLAAALVFGGALIVFVFSYAPFRRAYGQVAAGIFIGLLIPAAWFATGYLGADDFNPVQVDVADLHQPDRHSVQYIMLSTGSTLNFGIATVAGVLVGSFGTAPHHWPFPARGLQLAAAHVAVAVGARR